MSIHEKSVDLRVRRTRQLLMQAFLILIAKKTFQDISVQDITKTAMVNRSTFYDHFVDKYALLEHTVSDLFWEEIAGKLPVAIASWAMYGSAQYWSEGARKGTILEFAESVVPIIDGMVAQLKNNPAV